MDTESKLKILKECSDFSSEEKIDRFEDVLFSIKKDDSKDFSLLPELFALFSDKVDDYVMFSLVHTVESFPDPEYVCCFLENIDKIYKKSEYWANILFIRIINEESSLNCMKKNLTRMKDCSILLILIHQVLVDKYSNHKQKQIAAYLEDQIKRRC